MNEVMFDLLYLVGEIVSIILSTILCFCGFSYLRGQK